MTIKKLFPYLFLLLSVITYGQNERLKERLKEKDEILNALKNCLIETFIEEEHTFKLFHISSKKSNTLKIGRPFYY